MEIDITLEELTDMTAGTYLLLDIRDDVSYRYGTIPGAVSMPDVLEAADCGVLPRDKTLVLFCMHGRQSRPMAEALRENGYDARSLLDGYGSWLKGSLTKRDRSAEIEASLRSRGFHEKLFSRLPIPFRPAQSRR